MTDQTPSPQSVVVPDPLWMMHVIGPDDIYPAPDHAAAVEWCAYLNREIAPKVPEVLCVAVPAIWTGTAEEHAEGLAEAIKGWTVPAAPAPSSLAGGAAREKVARIVDPETFALIAHYTGIDRFDGLSPAEREPSVFKAYPDLKTARDAAYADADAILAALSPEAPARDLKTVCQRMADDYQTSDAHHPQHVLVGRADFETMVAALTPRHEAPAEGAGEEELIERGLRTIRAYDAVRYLRDALSATTARLTGYDWNADPEGLTKRQGDAFAAADKVFADLDAAVAAHPEIELPECQTCGGAGKIEETARTEGANQHSACVRTCDDCDGCGFAPDDESEPLRAPSREPEGGAVDDLREALIQADLKIRSLPGTDQSDVEFIRAALATREEASAEAGERDYPAEFEAWWATYRHRNRDVADYPVKKQIAFDAFYFAALRAQPPARDNRICRICDGGPGNEGVCLCGEEAWEQPPASEDAQPGGWLRAVDEEMVCAHLGVAEAEDSYETAKKKLANLIQWNIAVAMDPSVGGRPAPDALRVAVEASGFLLDRLKDLEQDVNERDFYGHVHPAAARLRQALAALQAEQGAK